MTARAIRIFTVSSALSLATISPAQEIQIAQLKQEIAEFNGPQFTYQVGIAGAAMQSRVVTGAPYQADEKSVMTQTLSDGNRIVQTNTSKLYRDQQGRTRVERSLSLPQAAEIEKTVLINDPITASHYVLDERNRTVLKGPSMTMHDAKVMAEASHRFEMGTKVAAEGRGVGPVTMMSFDRRTEGKPESSKTEDLGKQVIEGLSVEGTRTTVTIPAGAMFNEKPIEIVSERWYSPDLQMVIMSKRSDPRMGETVYTVSNINRANPDASLFQVPAGYAESEGVHPHVIKRVMTRE